VYEVATGRITKQLTVPDEDTRDLNIGAGEAWIPGSYSAEQYFIHDGVPVPKPIAEPVYDHAELRRVEYPPVEEFADAFYWNQRGDTARMDAYLAKIDAVKERFPKRPAGK
jgi:hypothetical protein